MSLLHCQKFFSTFLLHNLKYHLMNHINDVLFKNKSMHTKTKALNKLCSIHHTILKMLTSYLQGENGECG